MANLSPMTRTLLRCFVVSLAAPIVVMIIFRDVRPLVRESFVVSFFCSLGISVVSQRVVPPVIRFVGRPGWRLTAALSLALLVSGILGSLLGGFALFAFGFSSFDNLWTIYPFLLRLAGTLAVLSGLLAHFYETNTSQLREARAELKERQFHEERMKKVALEAQLSSLESRIQPHFLFNTLNSISALIARDPRRAEELVGRLASLLRSSLNMTQRGLITLDAELDIVRQYLEIERTRFSNRLKCSFDIAPEIGELLVPPFAVQSLVENAIKHAVATQDTLIDIQVVAVQTTAGLRIEIRDTGPGFDLSHVEPGHGLDNLISRLDALFGSAARLEVARRNDLCVVSLVVPI